jgi:hypothetical protein
MIEEQRSPRYLKTFTYHEIRQYAQNYGNSYLISEDNALFMEHVANEACKEIKEWWHLTNISLSDEKIQRQAILTSVYTTRVKELLEQEKDPKALTKGLMIGMVAGKMSLNTKFKDDYTLIQHATDRYNTMEAEIQQQMKLSSTLLGNSSDAIREEIIRTAHRCHAVTGKALSEEPLREFIKNLEKTVPTETNHKTIAAFINRMRELKSKTNQPITPELLRGAIDIQNHQDHLLNQSIQLSKDKMLQMEHQRALQHERGFERTL